jgi:hypothetical protein
MDAERNPSGILTDKKLQERERKRAAELREDVVELLKTNAEHITAMVTNLAFLLERGIHAQYDSLEDRLETMSVDGELAGNMEIQALAFLHRRDVCVWEEDAKLSRYRLRAVVEGGARDTVSEKPYNVLYWPDTAEARGYFDVLVPVSDAKQTDDFLQLLDRFSSSKFETNEQEPNKCKRRSKGKLMSTLVSLHAGM